MALTKIKAAGIAADAIDETKIADNGIDSEHYNDGSIDNAHLAANSVDSDNYVDGSIDHEHLADDAVDGDIIADNAVGLAHMAAGTDGVIITYDASGDPVHVGPGSDGQVLTSTGAGSPPAFEAIPASGTILKKTYYEIARATWTDSEFPDDDTIPQNDEGVEVFTQAYTPTNTSGCDIWVTAHFHLAETSNIAGGFAAGLFISSQTDALQVRSNYQDGSDSYHNGDITIIHKIATWSGARTFSLRASGTHSINYQHHGTGWAGTLYGANPSKSPFIIEEVAT